MKFDHLVYSFYSIHVYYLSYSKHAFLFDAKHKSLTVNNELFWAQHNAKISQAFPTGSNDIGRQLELVSKMIASSNCRGSDRDIFYLEVPQYGKTFLCLISLHHDPSVHLML